DDVAELLFVGEPPGGIQGNLEGGVVRGRGTELPGGDLHVLLADGGDHVAGGQVTRRELLRVEPDAHGVVAAAEHLHVAHARQPRELVLDVEHRVVAQVERVVTATGRGEVDDQGQVGGRLDRIDAEAAHFFRQARQRLCHAVLHLHLGAIDVRT